MPGKGNSNRLRLGRYSGSNQIYHIRIATWNRRPIFLDWSAGRCVARALIAVEPSAFTLCYVVMPDHLHWLMQVRDDGNLSSIVQKVKSLTTKNLRNSYLRNAGWVDNSPIWQRGYFDHALRAEENLVDVARYIVANPLRARLVTSIKEYPLWDAAWL